MIISTMIRETGLIRILVDVSINILKGVADKVETSTYEEIHRNLFVSECEIAERLQNDCKQFINDLLIGCRHLQRNREILRMAFMTLLVNFLNSTLNVFFLLSLQII